MRLMTWRGDEHDQESPCYSGLRNLNVCFATYLRLDREGEANFRIGTAAAREGRELAEDRTELLRLTNVLYACMRHAVRDLRVGDPHGEVLTDKDCVERDPTGKPKLPDLLKEGEAAKLLSLSAPNRCNMVAMRIQTLVEHHRRMEHVSERAAFECYQQLEAVLEAFKNIERIVSTPIPFTYLHMLQFILFFFVFSAPLVFCTTFHWIVFVPCIIVTMGFYGINEMGKAMQDPFNYSQPFHGKAVQVEHIRLTLG